MVKIWVKIYIYIDIENTYYAKILILRFHFSSHLDKDGKAQMIGIDKEDQILPAFQIVTKSW